EDARRPDAPPLRHLLAEYDPEALKDDFREGVKVGHPDMPQFEFSPMETDMLLSYISSIQAPEAE
ncbi:MAG: cytochrome c, partial [Hyphomonas sp.]|nr:cytochrome c [Hyphomonas sp.]